MADIRIQDAAAALSANLTDKIPVSNGTGLPATVTVSQVVNLVPVPSVVGLLDEASHDLLSHAGLPGIPTTLPASDVSAWAKAAIKPAYTANEVGAEAANANIQGHITSTGNTHGTTAAQVGAYTTTETDNLISQAVGSGTVWKATVSIGAYGTDELALAAAYPAANEGWTASMIESNGTYRYDAGTLSWMRTDAGAIPLAGPAIDGKLSAAGYNKLAGIAESANNYLHPVNHPASIITQDLNNRFTTDDEKAAWNAKDASGGYAGLTLFKLNLKNALGTVTNFFTTAATVARTWTMPDKDGTVAMTSDITDLLSETSHDTLDHTGLAGIPAAYEHPTGDGNMHVPATSTTNSGKVLTAGATAGALSWEVPASGGGLTNPMTTAGDIIIGGIAGAPERLAKGADGQVLTVVAGVPAYADASGGSATIDWTSPVVVTDTANLAYGNHYIVAVTAADKTLTLPEITAADYGKMLVVEIAAATTMLITIDGYAAQVIDGAATRVMWASEVAQLVATANGWTKVGGKSIPMVATLTQGADQIFNTSTNTLLEFNTITVDRSPPAMRDNSAANYKLACLRDGSYIVTAAVEYSGNFTAAGYRYCYIYRNGAVTTGQVSFVYAPATFYAFAISPPFNMAMSAGDYLQIYGRYTGTTIATSAVIGTAAGSGEKLNTFGLAEVCQW